MLSLIPLLLFWGLSVFAFSGTQSDTRQAGRGLTDCLSDCLIHQLINGMRELLAD